LMSCEPVPLTKKNFMQHLCIVGTWARNFNKSNQ
jgi:hypothetical protein